MNAKHLIAVVALAMTAGAALADDVTPDTTAATPSVRSRADVRAETLQARRAGQLLAAGDAAVREPAFHSTLARAAVKADVLAARARDELLPAGEQAAVAHPVPHPPLLRQGTLAQR